MHLYIMKQQELIYQQLELPALILRFWVFWFLENVLPLQRKGQNVQVGTEAWHQNCKSGARISKTRLYNLVSGSEQCPEHVKSRAWTKHVQGRDEVSHLLQLQQGKGCRVSYKVQGGATGGEKANDKQTSSGNHRFKLSVVFTREQIRNLLVVREII